MSKFFSKKYKDLVPYTPGEQPKDQAYIKLNTNESPFDLSKDILDGLLESRNPRLYSDISCVELRQKLASMFGVDENNIICGNGSDELLYFCFMAFCDDDTPAVFANITYGFYEVYANVNRIPYCIKNLNSDFTINVSDYLNQNKTIFIANPNAWTGILLSLDDIERIVSSNPDNVVVIDEAYVDFGGQSAVELTKKYDNLLVIQTFSKSRSMAGARLAFAIASQDLINDLNTIKFSVNPYNVNSLSQCLGSVVLDNDKLIQQNIKTIIENREYLVSELDKLNFETLPSKANFILTKHDSITGFDLYKKLKENGILVRYSELSELKDYVRITIGTKEQMDKLIDAIKFII